MKLRITNDAVRIRISKTEVELLKENESVTLEIIFPGSETFSCEVIPDNSDSVRVSMEANTLFIYLPNQEVKSWNPSEMIQLESVLYLENGKELLILVEKDFKRLSNRAREDESNLFSNPKKN